MSSRSSSSRWLVILCVTQASTVLVFLNFAGALPLIQDDLQLTNAQAGAIQAAGQIGYILAVLLLSSLTDFVGAERVIAGGALWAGLSNLGMALLANDAAGAVLFRASVGLGVAGIYMPGVRMLSQRFPPGQRGRALGIFVASFTVGSAASIALGGQLAATLGWRMAFALTSLGPLLGALVAWRSFAILSRGVPQPEAATFEPASLGDLLRSRSALLVTAIYTAHAWEVLGLRGWLAAYLAAFLSRSGVGLAQATQSGASLAGLATLLGAVSTASVAALSDHFGRTRTMILAAAASFLAVLGLGFSMTMSWIVVALLGLLAASLANADSAVISASLTEAVPPQYLGRALAVYSFLGFAAGGIAPLVFGGILDRAAAAGGVAPVTLNAGWSWAFASLSFGSLLALFLAIALHRRQAAMQGMSDRLSGQ